MSAARRHARKWSKLLQRWGRLNRDLKRRLFPRSRKIIRKSVGYEGGKLPDGGFWVGMHWRERG